MWTRLGKSVCVGLALLAGLTVRASADVHPVPLDKNTEPSKCLECHADKTKGKSVHSAMAAGCLSCHEIRVNRDVTRVKLIAATSSSLCLSCHADKKAADIKGTVHPPAVRGCTNCHDPHSSDNKNQLLKAVSGGEKENLCLGCHQTGLHVPEKGSRHAALDMGCDTCHTVHKTGAEATIDNRFHLTKIRAGPLSRLPRCERCRPAEGASEPALRHGQLSGVS
jgi:predicted CXXCH cytochrome family protein